MTEKPVLDVLRFERFAQQRILAQVDHPDRKIIASPPICVNLAKFLGSKRRRSFGGTDGWASVENGGFSRHGNKPPARSLKIFDARGQQRDLENHGKNTNCPEPTDSHPT